VRAPGGLAPRGVIDARRNAKGRREAAFFCIRGPCVCRHLRPLAKRILPLGQLANRAVLAAYVF